MGMFAVTFSGIDLDDETLVEKLMLAHVRVYWSSCEGITTASVVNIDETHVDAMSSAIVEFVAAIVPEATYIATYQE